MKSRMIEHIILNPCYSIMRAEIYLSNAYTEFAKNLDVKILLVGECLADEVFHKQKAFKQAFFPRTTVYSRFIQKGVGLYGLIKEKGVAIRIYDVILIYAGEKVVEDPLQLKLFQ